MNYKLILLLLTLNLSAWAQNTLEDGIWHADLQLNDSTNLSFILKTSAGTMVIENADERIELTDIRYEDDSVWARFPYYDSELRFTNLGPLLNGEFVNHGKTSNNVLYFRALKDMPYRFTLQPLPASGNLSGRWQLIFDGEEGVNKSNVAIFNQRGNRVTGTVLTATGDHRFLDGELNGNKLKLSTFNGAFVMLYDGILNNDGTLTGHFYSGKTGYDTWTAFRNDSASLPDPSSLSFIKPSAGKFNFSFPDINGKRWTMDDASFRNKVSVVQIMGTWCPNCLDESVFLNDYFQKNHASGVEMIAIDYERTTDSVKVWNNIKRIRERLGITYPIVFGGISNRDSASATLPMIDKIFAYPTTIFVDKKGVVRKIHTGFSGPAAPEEFEHYQQEFDVFVRNLLAE